MSENELANYPGLYLRGGVWYVRKKVPIDLRYLYNGDQIRKSLETGEKREAMRLYATRRAEIDREFEQKREELGREDKITRALRVAKLERLSSGEIDSLVWDWWQSRAQLRRPDIDTRDQSEVLSDIESDLREILAPEPEEGNPAARVADQLLMKKEMAARPRKVGAITTASKSPIVDRSTAQYAYLCDRVKTGLEIEARLAIDHLSGTRSAPLDPMFNPASGVPLRSGVIPVRKTVGEMIGAYRADRASRRGEESTARKFDLLLEVTKEVIGQSFPVSDLSREHCIEIVSFLRALPPNAQKRFSTLTLSQIKERAERDQLKGLAAGTLASYVQGLSAMLRWAKRGGWGIDVDTSDLVPDRTPEVKRRGFTTKELFKIFPHLAACRGQRPSRFWVPAVALYTGARLGEICQLRVEDVVQVDTTWCLNLTLYDAKGQRIPEKSLKTKSSERYVPLHSELIDAGFLDLREERKGDEWLFLDIEPNPKGNRSAYTSKWFGLFLDRIGYPDKSLCFHSFRHGFRDACRLAELQQETAEALGGWSSVGQATRYGDRALVPVLARAIEKIGYGEFALRDV